MLALIKSFTKIAVLDKNNDVIYILGMILFLFFRLYEGSNLTEIIYYFSWGQFDGEDFRFWSFT